MQISYQGQYGPLQSGFAFDLGDGYRVLVGRNNSGKSAILQLVFRTLMRDGQFGPDKLCLLLTERNYVQPTAETGGQNLVSFNSNLLGYVDGTPYQHSGRNIDWSTLPRLLLNHTDTLGQINALNRLLTRMGLPELLLRSAQLIHLENIPVALQGSGIRSLLSILAALTDLQLSVVLIDEPELSLEPDIQRVLRDILVEASGSKRILVATHSHLFLNRADPSSNFLVQSSGGVVSVSPVVTQEQLYDLTFQLLGNSTEDLFFPGNFLVVEGSSDQAILERVRDLLRVPVPKLKVLSATGKDNISSGIDALFRVLVPVVMRDSPYSTKVVALIDQPSDPEARAITELKRLLGDRLFILDKLSVEEYIPEEIYTRIGRNKTEDIQRIVDLKRNYEESGAFKRELSQQIAAQLSEDDLERLPIIVSAVQKATV